MTEATTNPTSTEAGFATGPKSASGRIQVAKKDYDSETATFSIVFADGTSHEVALESLPQEIQLNLALHGLSQKLGDSYASVKGNVAAAKEKFEATLKQLLAGEWAAKREGEGGSKVTELAEAIARIKGVPVATANAAVGKASDDQIKGWKANAKVKAVIAEIRAEKAAKRAEKQEGEASKDIEIDLAA